LTRDNHKCQNILLSTSSQCLNPATDVHHIIPVCHGGTDDLDNLISYCKKCHYQQGSHKVKLGIKYNTTRPIMISITPNTHNELLELGTNGDTFDMVIRRLIEYYKR